MCIRDRCSRELSDAGLLELFELTEVELTQEELSDFGDASYVLYRLQSEIQTQYITRKQNLLKTIYTYLSLIHIYPVLVAGTEKADIDVGKYGRMWIKYIKEEYPMRYKSLVRFGELEERADEVNDTAYELLDDIEAKWLKKHKPKRCV